MQGKSEGSSVLSVPLSPADATPSATPGEPRLDSARGARSWPVAAPRAHLLRRGRWVFAVFGLAALGAAVTLSSDLKGDSLLSAAVVAAALGCALVAAVLHLLAGAMTGYEQALADVRTQADEQVLHAAARAEALVRAASHLNAQLELDALLDTVCEQTARALGVPAATISLYDDERRELVFAAGFGLPAEYRARMAPLPRAIYDEYVARMGRTVIVEDVQSLPDLPNADLYVQLDIRTTVGVSMMHEGQLVGRLNIATVGTVRHFNADELAFLQGLADQAALAIVNARLYSAAQQDLTQRVQAEEELRQSMALVQQADAERRQLLSRVVEAQEEERRRIAEDIHDDSVQVMAAVGMRLQVLRRRLDDAEQQKVLDQLEQTVSKSIARLRRLMFELRPAVLDREGLAAALHMYLDQTFTDPAPDYHIENDLEREPPTETRVILYRMAQEALTNVRKHARAHRVDVVLREQDGGFLVQVRDDGLGFDPPETGESAPDHLGVVSMRERAEMAGGWFEIHSAPGAGATVEFWLPAAQEDSGSGR